MDDLTVCSIWDVPTHPQRFEDAIKRLLRWSEAGCAYVCTCPVYTLMQGIDNAPVRHALKGAHMVTADGMPIVWLQRRHGYPDAERVYGPDMMQALCERGGSSVRHVFYGGETGVAAQLAARLTAQFPVLNVVGTLSPPMLTIGTTPDQATIDVLNALDAHIIWVGLGSPKQDLWMHLYRPYLNTPLLIGVGAAFDFLSGSKRQAPRWMQRAGLEWLYRLAQEPRRLGQRYLVYNTRFLWRLVRYPLRQSLGVER